MTNNLFASVEVEGQRRRWLFVGGEGLAAFLIPALMVMLIQQVVGGILGVDGFYHIRMTEMYGRGLIQAVGSDFHWTQHSIWNGGFSDKDWLWHILFVPLTWAWGATPEGLEWCARVAAAFGAGLIGLALWRVLRGRGIPFPLLWVVFAVSCSETIVFRLSLPRSFLLSVMFVLVGSNLIWHRAGVALGALAMLYTLSYTAPHVLVVIAVVATLVRVMWPEEATTRRREGLLGARTLAWVMGGMVVGALLHPQSANLVRHWTVQNVMVPLYALKSHGLAEFIGSAIGVEMPANFAPMNLNIGAEMSATDGRTLLTNHVAGVALVIGAWVVAAMTRVRPRREDLFWMLLTAMFGVMMLASQRFAEYFFPVGTVAGAGLVCYALSSGELREWAAFRPRLVKVGGVALVLAVVLHGALRVNGLIGTVVNRPQRAWQPVAEAMKRHIPAGTSVFHPSWDGFTQLFFFAPEYDYVVGLDPTFLYLHSPDLYQSYDAIRRGKSRTIEGDFHSVDRLVREAFGMHWFVMLNDGDNKLAQEMQHAEVAGRITLVERGEDDEWRLYFLGKH